MKGLHYAVNLGDTVEDILENDFWMMEKFTPGLMKMTKTPIKFANMSSIFVRRGHFKADINLIPMEVSAPCIVNVGPGQILNPDELSDDFEASFIVLSPRMKEKLFIFINDPFFYGLSSNHPVLPITPDMVDKYEELYADLYADFIDKENPYRQQSILHTLLVFLFRHGIRSLHFLRDSYPSHPGRMSERFLKLVRQHFKTHRFLEFYAEQLQITPKHLSRTVKMQTGYTAVDWIERFIVLEAQVLLKSSDLHVQQIADELNFPSQSVFGKYFKKKTGMSPREFRNRE